MPPHFHSGDDANGNQLQLEAGDDPPGGEGAERAGPLPVRGVVADRPGGLLVEVELPRRLAPVTFWPTGGEQILAVPPGVTSVHNGRAQAGSDYRAASGTAVLPEA
jgi:hypothetical protein